MYSQHVTLSTFSLISLSLTAVYLSQARHSLCVLKMLFNPNQSLNSDRRNVLQIVKQSVPEFWLMWETIQKNQSSILGHTGIDRFPNVFIKICIFMNH